MTYVIIGNSFAGVWAVEGIRELDKDGEIIIISFRTLVFPSVNFLFPGKSYKIGCVNLSDRILFLRK